MPTDVKKIATATVQFNLERSRLTGALHYIFMPHSLFGVIHCIAAQSRLLILNSKATPFLFEAKNFLPRNKTL